MSHQPRPPLPLKAVSRRCASLVVHHYQSGACTLFQSSKGRLKSDWKRVQAPLIVLGLERQDSTALLAQLKALGLQAQQLQRFGVAPARKVLGEQALEHRIRGQHLRLFCSRRASRIRIPPFKAGVCAWMKWRSAGTASSGAPISRWCASSLVREMDIHYLRYGPPIHRSWLGSEKYDWPFAEQTFGELKRLEIIPITDLCRAAFQTGSATSRTLISPLCLRLMLAISRRAFLGFSCIRRSTRCLSAPPFRLPWAGGTSRWRATRRL